MHKYLDGTYIFIHSEMIYTMGTEYMLIIFCIIQHLLKFSLLNYNVFILISAHSAIQSHLTWALIFSRNMPINMLVSMLDTDQYDGLDARNFKGESVVVALLPSLIKGELLYPRFFRS